MTEAKTPVYFVIGESDEYYGSEPFKEAYQILYELYAEQGLAKSEIDNLLVLDIKEKNYFAGTKVTYQHGGGYLFCRDEKIMGWLFWTLRVMENILQNSKEVYGMIVERV